MYVYVIHIHASVIPWAPWVRWCLMHFVCALRVFLCVSSLVCTCTQLSGNSCNYVVFKCFLCAICVW